MGKLTTDFELHEFIHPELYNHPAIGERSLDFISSMMAPTAQAIKDMCSEHLGFVETVTINNWRWGGNRVDSGLRLPYNELTTNDIRNIRRMSDKEALKYLMGIVSGVGARFSGHHFGSSIDCKFKHMTPVEVQSMILDNRERFPHITRMENARKTETWLHCDIGMRNSNDIKIFDPW